MKKFINYLILALLMYIALVAYCNNGVFDFVKEWESLKKTFNNVVEFFKGDEPATDSNILLPLAKSS